MPESFYEIPVEVVSHLVGSVIAFPAIRTIDILLLLWREVYESHRIGFAGVDEIAGFDRTVDRIPTINRIEPRPTRDLPLGAVF